MINHIKLLRAIVLGLFIFIAHPTSAAVNKFPVFANIKPNVNFWKIVYSQYSSKKGLIHDSKNLAVIYEVINLYDRKVSSNYRRNRKKIKLAKKRYSKILLNLAKGHTPESPTEKKIIAMFGGHPSAATLREAAHNVRFQLCLKDRFRQGIIDSGRYLAEMKQIFRQNHLPTDLAYLPHVESSFNYEAYSKFGAAGIWQFIRSTGRRFLTISYTVDERRDPITATRAAAKYLKENYQKLNSWPLALTAYNHGASSMCRAQKKFGTYDKIIDCYQNRRFGFASRNFYPEFLAAREISKNYKKYFPGIQVDKPVSSDIFALEGYLDIEDLAKFSGISIDQIKKLNPALRRPVFSGQKYIPRHYQLRLPKGIKNKISSIPVNLYKKSQKRSRFYRVARGDTAGKIARMQRVKLRDLLDFNQLDRRAIIYIGQNLRIPAPGEKRLASLSPNKNKPKPTTIKPQKVERPKVAVTNTKPMVSQQKSPARTGTKPTSVTPSRKETKKRTIIGQLDKNNKEAAPQIAMEASHTTNWQKNNIELLSGHIISEEGEQPAIEAPPENLISLNPEVLVGNFQVEKVFTDKRGKKIGIVQVEESETLGHYADWLGIPTQKIRNLNNLSFHRQIKTQQKIKIPLDKSGKEAFEERRYEFHKQISEDFFTAFKVTAVQTYTVKRGDNIWTITHDELDLPFWLINRYNHGVNFDKLKPGQKLLFPVVEKIQTI